MFASTQLRGQEGGEQQKRGSSGGGGSGSDPQGWKDNRAQPHKNRKTESLGVHEERKRVLYEVVRGREGKRAKEEEREVAGS